MFLCFTSGACNISHRSRRCGLRAEWHDISNGWINGCTAMPHWVQRHETPLYDGLTDDHDISIMTITSKVLRVYAIMKALDISNKSINLRLKDTDTRINWLLNRMSSADKNTMYVYTILHRLYINHFPSNPCSYRHFFFERVHTHHRPNHAINMIWHGHHDGCWLVIVWLASWASEFVMVGKC